ncbi:MAG: DPP IV N-terminal domain-containing protein [Crocinitomicaceae bacterium]|nr:DPP IV N-terminal domain-containing protein [Crocinitomicaceae bacterium]MDG1658331.1 DPP IV N-terminal domain-containing protein [Crocinitomicaceae bacterium]MDG2440389.1 DPP IV N-terminal domain-containing protein [Crocinitomicaceae bacterium]
MKQALLFVLLITIFNGHAQEQKAEEDYQRAVEFLPENVFSKGLNLRIGPNWFEDETGLWFKDQTREGTFYRKVLFKTGVITDLFDHQKIADLFTETLGSPVKKGDLGLDDIKYLNPKEMLLTIGEEQYELNIKKNTLSLKEKEEEVEVAKNLSPDGKWEAYTEYFNLYLRNTETGEKKQLTTDGTKDYAYGSWYGWADIMEGENANRPEHFAVEWSPDGESLVARDVYGMACG